MIKQIFVNLLANDLNKTKDFWSKLGFSFNPQFTDENAAALVLGENIFAMLLTPDFFGKFTKKEIIDAQKNIEVINAISVESREKVNELVDKALAAGGKTNRDSDDYEWMFNRSFDDIDGHTWEVVYMDMSKAPAHPGAEVK